MILKSLTLVILVSQLAMHPCDMLDRRSQFSFMLSAARIA